MNKYFKSISITKHSQLKESPEAHAHTRNQPPDFSQVMTRNIMIILTISPKAAAFHTSFRYKCKYIQLVAQDKLLGACRSRFLERALYKFLNELMNLLIGCKTTFTKV